MHSLGGLGVLSFSFVVQAVAGSNPVSHPFEAALVCVHYALSNYPRTPGLGRSYVALN